MSVDYNNSISDTAIIIDALHEIKLILVGNEVVNAYARPLS